MMSSTALAAAGAGEQKSPSDEARRIEAGAYSIRAALDRHWSVDVNRDAGYVIFDYTDHASAQGELAKIGVFRFVVPPAARATDRAELGAAYAVKDVAGVQKALFGSVTKLGLVDSRPRESPGGTVYEYREPTELSGTRSRSTKFVRAFVLYPPTYAQDGSLFLLVGLQRFHRPQIRPDALAKMPELLDGLRVGDRPE